MTEKLESTEEIPGDIQESIKDKLIKNQEEILWELMSEEKQNNTQGELKEYYRSGEIKINKIIEKESGH